MFYTLLRENEQEKCKIRIKLMLHSGGIWKKFNFILCIKYVCTSEFLIPSYKMYGSLMHLMWYILKIFVETSWLMSYNFYTLHLFVIQGITSLFSTGCFIIRNQAYAIIVKSLSFPEHFSELLKWTLRNFCNTKEEMVG